MDEFQHAKSLKVAVIGGGESAASVIHTLLEMAKHDGPTFTIDLINRHAAIYTRSEGYSENQWFSNPKNWAYELDEESREELIRRSDRGVFSPAVQEEIRQSDSVSTVPAHVLGVEKAPRGVRLRMAYGKIGKPKSEVYDKVIVALGFDPWSMLNLLPARFRPKTTNRSKLKEFYRTIERNVDKHLCLDFSYVPRMDKKEFLVHLPAVLALAQGPGFPSLCCLGHLSDRILSRYLPVPPKEK